MYSKNEPFHARILERQLLNGPGSTKETYHIALNITGSNIQYQVGDSIGVLPTNDRMIVHRILKTLHLSAEDEVYDARANTRSTIYEFLLKKANLAKCTSSFLKRLQDAGAGGDKLKELLIPENKAELTAFLQTHQLLDIVQTLPGIALSAQELCASLLPLMPRFYSIASSLKMFPDEIHLTVASLTYTTNHEKRHGVGSYFLCNIATDSDTIPIYVQPSNGFTLPENPDALIILIGPGTGVAPFRAFLQERISLQHSGRNWLFFGERHRKTDFYYSDYWSELEQQGRLRLDLAFSRDTSEKVYVQHKLWEQRADLWEWLRQGAYLYVCGDANQMAKDVDATLRRIVHSQSGMTEEASQEWLKNLRREKRYLLDVY